jgi:phage gpG-like protein
MASFQEVIVKIERAIEGLNMKPALEEIQGFLEKETGENFEQSKTPDGAAWAKLKPSTLRSRVRDLQGNKGPRRRNFGTRPLLVYRNLKRAAAGKGAGAIRQISGNTLTFGVDEAVIRYAGAHQNDDSKIQRKFLGVTPGMAEKIEDIAVDHIIRQLGG